MKGNYLLWQQEDISYLFPSTSQILGQVHLYISLFSLSLSLTHTHTFSPASTLLHTQFVHIHTTLVKLHTYLFKQRFAEAQTERVLMEHGTCHEGAHTAQQLLVFLQHKPWQVGREILGKNRARLKTVEDRNKERRQVRQVEVAQRV